MKWFRRSSSADPAKVSELHSLPRGPARSGAEEHLAEECDKLRKLIDPEREILERFPAHVARINGENWIVVEDIEAPGCSGAGCSPAAMDAVFVPPKEKLLEEKSLIASLGKFRNPAAVEETREKKSFFNFGSNIVMGTKCPEQPRRTGYLKVADKSIGSRPVHEYFGLSDKNGISVKFNIVEYRPLRERSRFDNGIDFPGKIVLNDEVHNLTKPCVGEEAKEKEVNPFLRLMRLICKAIWAFLRWTGNIIAPPRLLALRGSRGRPCAPGAPGEAVRAYALHLAADKTTTFAQNVDNFISCNKDSKETCPHVVMRNMRQFMSGMKNYLVKHGEREFEKEVEKERLKLRANEFLNLDAILEGVLNGAVVTPLRKHVYGLLADKFAKRGDVALLTQGLRMAKALSPLRLGIRPSVRVPSDPEMVVISQFFVKMQEADSPLDKLENLLSAISAIFNAMKSGGTATGGPLGADDFLPVLVLTLARCNVAGAELEAELMAGLLPPPLLSGEGGYYLTTLFGAVAVLKKLASSDDPNKTLDWRTGSLGSGLMTSTSVGCGSGGVARVLMPDECSGALRCVALPWRPGARARDLCRQLAHRARITNPQDYALFALRDGEETLINDTDYPQDMVENNKTNCMLAYKRIDAKIAWPKQALQSFP